VQRDQRSEESIATLCRREGIVTNLYCRWSKEFLEGGKKQLQGDTRREATSDEVSTVREENAQLKELIVASFSPSQPAMRDSRSTPGPPPRGHSNGYVAL
jgi:transposase-like protein